MVRCQTLSTANLFSIACCFLSNICRTCVVLYMNNRVIYLQAMWMRVLTDAQETFNETAQRNDQRGEGTHSHSRPRSGSDSCCCCCQSAAAPRCPHQQTQVPLSSRPGPASTEHFCCRCCRAKGRHQENRTSGGTTGDDCDLISASSSLNGEFRKNCGVHLPEKKTK